MVVALLVTALATGAILASVNHWTQKPIAEKAAQTLTMGIRKVMGQENIKLEAPQAITLKIEGQPKSFTVHPVTTLNGTRLGAAVESTTMGFGGDLTILVGFNMQGCILGYTILQTSETPGLGIKADQWFQKGAKGDIIGRNVKDHQLQVSKDGGDVDAITASTITSRAFLRAVNQAYTAYQALADSQPSKK